MTKRGYLVVTAIVVILVLAGIVLFTRHAPVPRARHVVVGHLPIVGDLPVFVAAEKGYFAKQGLDVELVELHSGNEAINALVAGKTAMHATVGSSSLFAAEAAAPGELKVILSAEETADKYGAFFITRKGSSISSLEDLKGRKVGTYTGLTHLLTAKAILAKFMDVETDVEFVQVDPNLQLQALEAGQFDCLFSIEPFPTMAVEKGIGEVLEENVRAKHLVMPFWAAGMVVTSKLSQDDPAVVNSFVRALEESVDFIEAHEQEARAILPKYTGLSESTTAKVHLYRWAKLGEEDRVAAQKLADLFHDEGLIPAKISVDSMFYQK